MIGNGYNLVTYSGFNLKIPHLVSNSIGTIELLNDGKDALIIEPKDIDAICDAIIRLKSDKVSYEMISRNGMAAVEIFAWENLYCEKAEARF